MRIFVRILLTSWIAILCSVAILSTIPSISTPAFLEPLRPLPIASLQACAQAMSELGSTDVQDRSSPPRSECYGGQLLPAISSPTLDIKGVPLTHEQLALVSNSKDQTAPVIRAFNDRTDIAVRSDPRSASSALFVASIPLSHHLSSQWQIGALLRRIVLSGIMSMLWAAYFVRPITRLNEVAEKFGSGNLKVRLVGRPARRKDEFGDLGRTFNEMASRIELLVARQRSFLAHASHELGSPLTRLNIALALAKRKAGGSLSPELNRISQESERLNALVKELLFLARLQSGTELGRAPVEFDVSSTVREAQLNAQFEADQLGKSVVMLRSEPFRIVGYPDLMLRAIENILRNAIRFAQPGGSIEIECFPGADRTSGFVRVQDDGPGIPAGMEEAIFEPFVTISRSNNQEGAGGSGLGLSITRQAVLANSGSVVASSESPKGLNVIIEVPLS